jgi:outer membrane lipoprotein-sorting protein
MIASLLFAVAVSAAPGTPEFITDLLNQVDDLYRGAQSHSVLEMEVKTKNYERSMSLESWSKGKDYSLVRILSPKKDRGTATLKDKRDMFSYLSNTGRTVKISGAMRAGAWMGSHFTNDDLMRDSRMVDDYTIKQLADDGAAYHFELTPRPGRPVVWGKLEVWIDQKALIPTKQLFFDEDGKAVRSLEFQQLEKKGNRVLPKVLVMKPLDGSDEYTKITYKDLSFEVKLDDGFFSLRNLTSL